MEPSKTCRFHAWAVTGGVGRRRPVDGVGSLVPRKIGAGSREGDEGKLIVSMSALPRKPRLRVSFTPDADGKVVELHTAGGVLEAEPPENVEFATFVEVLRRLDGVATVREIAEGAGLDGEVLREIIEPGVVWGLIDDGATAAASSGLAVMSRLEDLLNGLLEELVFSGPFWRGVLEDPKSLPPNVYFGFGLENWFFLYRETEFDSAVLALAESAEMRSMLNEFYQEEHRHDDIVVRAFQPLGITKDDLRKARPLPTTTALIKMLSWWARTDPLFFMATIGVLEGRLDTEGDGEQGRVVYDSFIAACDHVGLDPGFVEPMRAHARVNAGHDHGSVSRQLFALVPGVDEATEQRWRAKAHLFVETYAAFFNGVVAHYSDDGRPMLRTVEI